MNLGINNHLSYFYFAMLILLNPQLLVHLAFRLYSTFQLEIHVNMSTTMHSDQLP